MVSEGLKKWRSHLKRGEIMKPSTFKSIQEKAMKKYHISKSRAAKVAGKAYWQAAKHEYKELH